MKASLNTTREKPPTVIETRRRLHVAQLAAVELPGKRRRDHS
jgi:hypothetical protein